MCGLASRPDLLSKSTHNVQACASGRKCQLGMVTWCNPVRWRRLRGLRPSLTSAARCVPTLYGNVTRCRSLCCLSCRDGGAGPGVPQNTAGLAKYGTDRVRRAPARAGNGPISEYSPRTVPRASRRSHLLGWHGDCGTICVAHTLWHTSWGIVLAAHAGTNVGWHTLCRKVLCRKKCAAQKVCRRRRCLAPQAGWRRRTREARTFSFVLRENFWPI